MGKLDGAVSLVFRSNQKFTEMAMLVLSCLKNALAIDDDEFFKVEISVREAVNNAIVHGNRLDADKLVRVRFTVKQKTLRVEVKDQNSERVDFGSIEDRINSCDLLSPSGRGITIMRSYMDSFEFVCEGDGNRVVMEKSLS